MIVEAIYKGTTTDIDGNKEMHFKHGDKYYWFKGYEAGHNKGDKARISTTGYSIASIHWHKGKQT